MRSVLDPIADVRGRQVEHLGGARGGDLVIPDHVTPAELRLVFRERGWPFEEYYRFVFVRNPWSRLVSLYRHIRGVNPGFHTPFDEWLLNSRPNSRGGGEEGENVARFRRFGAYALDNFICDDNGVRLVSEVFRLEDMPGIPEKLRLKGIPVNVDFMPAINRPPPVDVNQYYPAPALRAVVAMRYAKDIAEFRYQYPG